MSVAYTINVQDGDALAAIKGKVAQCDPHKVATRVAVETSKHWRKHLAGLPKNKQGYPSTGFWEEAARRVIGVAVGGDAVLRSDKLGLNQRLKGGQIVARHAKNLTIPICAEAYGTSVKDWGIKNLTLVIMADKRKFLALWLGNPEVNKRFQNRLGKLTKRAETTAQRVAKFKSGLSFKKPDVIFFRGGGNGTAAHAEKHANLKFLFVLVHSVEQAANPNVIPPDLGDVAIHAVEEAIK